MAKSKQAKKPNKQQQMSRRAQGKLRGRGDYSITRYPEAVTAIQDIDRRLAKMEVRPSIGSSLGRFGGSLLGNSAAGEALGRNVERMFGFGDYTVKTNSLFTKDSAGQSMVPQFSNNGRTITVRVREFITDIKSAPTLVSGSTPFDIKKFRINPSDPATFPWLSTIATQFDQYEPSGVVFEYRSTSSEYNGTNQALGTVVMATQYDVADVLFVDKPTMEASDYANSTKPSLGALHGIECDPSERPTEVLYCGTANTGFDARLYDLGNFSIATQGCSAANVTLGELWVSYDISFYKKSKNYPIQYFVVAYTSTGVASLFNTLFAGPVTTNNYIPTFVNSSMTLPSNIQSGSYFMIFYLAGTTVTLGAHAYTNCTASLVNTSSTGTYCYQTVLVTLTGGVATIGFNVTGTPTSMTVRIFQGYPGMLL